MTGDTAPCLLCGGRSSSHLVSGYDRIHPEEKDFEYSRCDSCGLVFLNPLPTPEEIPSFYPREYVPHQLSRVRNKTGFLNRFAVRNYYGAESLHRSSVLRRFVRWFSSRIMRDLCEAHGACRLLDVGCGSGGLMERHRDLGWTVCGIELSPNACEACRSRGLEVHPGTVLDAPLAGRQFDVILLSHVIEHVLDPVGLLRKMREFIAPGGRIILRTPNIHGIGFLMYHSCWSALEAPRHVVLFSPRTLSLLAKRAGFTVRRLKTRSEANMLCESRHYAKTQGERLPDGLEARRALLEFSNQSRRKYKLYRKAASPMTQLLALAGRGDTMEAELLCDPGASLDYS